VIQVGQGVLDPVLHVAETQGGTRLTIDADDTALTPECRHDLNAIARQLSQQIPDIQSFEVQESASPEPHIALILMLRAGSFSQFHPQIRSNTGSLVTIGLSGERASLPPGDKALMGEHSEKAALPNNYAGPAEKTAGQALGKYLGKNLGN